MIASQIEGKTSQQIKAQLQQLKDRKSNLNQDLQVEISQHYSDVVQFVHLVSQCVGDMAQIKEALLSQQPLINSAEFFQDPQTSDEPIQVHQLQSTTKQLNPNLLWLTDDCIDELDVALAHREYDMAISLLQRAELIFQEQPQYYQIKEQVEQRTQSLSTLLLSQKDFKRASQLKQFKLQAQKLFLFNEEQFILQKCRLVQYDGELLAYIQQYSHVHFTLLGRSVQKYKQLFGDQYVVLFGWVVDQMLADYLKKFSLLVFSGGKNDFRTVIKCLQCVSDGVDQMSRSGIDLGALFMQSSGGLMSEISASLELYYGGGMMSQLVRSLASEEFTQLLALPELQMSSFEGELIVLNGGAGSPSLKVLIELLLKALYQDLLPFIVVSNQVSIIANGTFDAEIVRFIIQIVDYYSRDLMNQLLNKSSQLSAPQRLQMIIDLCYLSDDLMPYLCKSLGEGFVLDSLSYYRAFNVNNNSQDQSKEKCKLQDVIELDKLLRRCRAIVDVAYTLFYVSTHRDLCSRSTFIFGPLSVNKNSLCIDYSSPAYPVVELLLPSDAIIRFVKELHSLQVTILDTIKQWTVANPVFERKCCLVVEDIMKAVLDLFVKDLAADGNWIARKVERPIGYTGLHQLILDVHYFSKMCDLYLSPPLVKLLSTDVCGRAVKVYFKQALPQDQKRVLKGGEFYDARYNDFIKREKVKVTFN